MGKSSIEWLNGGSTWNPLKAVDPGTGKVGWHCVKIAEECANCYADVFNVRKMPSGGTGLHYNVASPAKVFIDGDVLHEIFEAPEGEFVFPCSMTDVAGEFVDPRDSFAVLKACSLAHHVKFLILTKRPQRLRWLLDPATLAAGATVPSLSGGAVRLNEHAQHYFQVAGQISPQPNLWFGVSAGTQKTWERYAPHLEAIAELGFNTWVSAEPLIEEVDYRPAQWAPRTKWVVIGGESGASARLSPLPGMRRALRDWQRFGVPVFVKQLGRRPSGPWLAKNAPVGSAERWHLRAAKGNDRAEWPIDLRVQQYPVLLEGVKP